MEISHNEYKKIKHSADVLSKYNASNTYISSVIANQNGLPVDGVNELIFDTDEEENLEYDDVKTSVGSYVRLKNDKDPTKVYEVIRFTNKESIKLRDLETNKIIKANENEILPIVTENVMKTNLQEANYNLSIDNLESVDAETLSQILSLAGQAESSSDTLGSEVTDPMGVGEIETVDMVDEPSIETDDVYSDYVLDDESIDDEFGYEEYEQFPVSESKCVKEDVLLDPQSDDETYNAEKDEEIVEETEDTLDDEEIIEETEDLTVGEEIVEETEDIDSDIEDIDSAIAECLKLAGVELNEVSDEDANKGKKDLPTVIGRKTSFSCEEKDGFKPGENQRPDYKCVKTKDVMGKEATEGTKEPLNVAKVCCNESKIKSICETATRMYAKKDHSEWLALDRRYVEKLLNEGVGYENASKMLLKAKQGK